jgi:hypothetical protein
LLLLLFVIPRYEYHWKVSYFHLNYLSVYQNGKITCSYECDLRPFLSILYSLVQSMICDKGSNIVMGIYGNYRKETIRYNDKREKHIIRKWIVGLKILGQKYCKICWKELWNIWSAIQYSILHSNRKWSFCKISRTLKITDPKWC